MPVVGGSTAARSAGGVRAATTTASTAARGTAGAIAGSLTHALTRLPRVRKAVAPPAAAFVPLFYHPVRGRARQGLVQEPCQSRLYHGDYRPIGARLSFW